MYKCLARLNPNAAPGLDSITSQQLKLGKLNLIPKLCTLFNRIIATGIIPSSWKKGKIITIYKGAGDKTDPSNYRPITLLSCLSKFFELCIYDQLYTVINEKLPDFQHGFRRNHSVTTAHFEISDFIYNALDNQKIACLVQLDIAKAYDSVNPKLLLQKLINDLNPNGALKELFKNFLYERQVATFANDVLSNFGVVEIGIPQGGVLPPLLFAFFMSDIKSLNLEGNVVMYADDTQLLYSCHPHEFDKVEVAVKNDLNKVNEFLASIQMKLNQSKTTVTKFGTRQQLARLHQKIFAITENLEVDLLSSVRSLGLTYDENVFPRPLRKAGQKLLYCALQPENVTPIFTNQHCGPLG
ncbi:RNA-directed DNA polymerase from mobile element jockey [Toxocara canis]|uniref:RNA-directed DNA polymerase from mobile element jockey n=1 Tax=Toxocara canis TaxID=6265 RepID=A0A0B2W123_TOXCA|nr:RNA-directed DNA polymerase from mobile element jockey [Toxocara canis]